jgi:adenylate cyclase
LPDLILMDVGLPDLDGVTALQHLRADTTTASIPVVAVTAYAMPEDRERLLGAGFDGYLAKPIDVRAFASQIARYAREGDGDPTPAGATILIVDDTPANIRLLEAILAPRGYRVVRATSGEEALSVVASEQPHLVLLDIQMPGKDGYEVCRELRAASETEALPVIMVTSSVGQERLLALEAGADDFISKPFNQAELLARVRSLVKIKEYQDQLKAQAAQLAELNQTLQERVDEQVAEGERLHELRRFLSAPVADAVVTGRDSNILAIHRREIAVVFCDLRGFTAFTGSVEPEEAIGALLDFHRELGRLVTQLDATVGHFAGDGVMLFFNDPLPCPDPALRAVRMGLGIRDVMVVVTERWQRHGHDLGFGVGISFGYATLGEMGFEGRHDYAAVGGTVNLASRLCDEAVHGQILIGQRAFAEVEAVVDAHRVADLTLKGFPAPMPAWSVAGLKAGAAGG